MLAVPVGDDALDVLALEMDGRVERLGDHGLVDQVQKTVLGVVCGAVEAEGQTGVEVGVVAHHGLDELHVVGVVVEDLVVGDEADEGAVLLGGAFTALVLLQYTF